MNFNYTSLRILQLNFHSLLSTYTYRFQQKNAKCNQIIFLMHIFNEIFISFSSPQLPQALKTPSVLRSVYCCSVVVFLFENPFPFLYSHRTALTRALALSVKSCLSRSHKSSSNFSMPQAIEMSENLETRMSEKNPSSDGS